jgi:hypothetical protein
MYPVISPFHAQYLKPSQRKPDAAVRKQNSNKTNVAFSCAARKRPWCRAPFVAVCLSRVGSVFLQISLSRILGLKKKQPAFGRALFLCKTWRTEVRRVLIKQGYVYWRQIPSRPTFRYQMLRKFCVCWPFKVHWLLDVRPFQNYTFCPTFL